MNKLPTYFQTFHRPVWVEINLDNVVHNIHEFQRIIPQHTQIVAVVKADAYGHGAKQIAQAALRAGASQLAVALVEEGTLLRRQGITAPIIVLGISPPGTERAIIEHELTPTICSRESAQNFSMLGQTLGKIIPFHLKLDTGMGRIGLRPEDLEAFVKTLKTLSQLELKAVFSHFSKADERNKAYTQQQLTRYHKCIKVLQKAGITPHFQCLANSAATIDLPETCFDMVRIGIALYGLYPSEEVDITRIHLHPVMSWKTQIVHLKTLPPGESISYGGEFITQRPTVVATLPVGYADGFRRRLWNTGGEVLIKGQRAPIIGRVCMDMCMIDATDIKNVRVGDDVVLIGSQGKETISADDMAKHLETINYEITCLVGKRVPRVYIEKGNVIGIQSLLGEMQPLPLQSRGPDRVC